MPQFEMFQVDAFADRLFTGNPAAVLILDDWLPDATLLAIAMENNLAETAFARPRGAGHWDLRWFTPVHEVDFCGHATLATAHVLAAHHGVTGALTFATRVGRITVTQADGLYRLDLPAFAPEPLDALPPDLAGILPEAPVTLFRNFENVFADLGSEAAVRAFVPDLARIARLGTQGLVVTGQGDGLSGADFVSRYFAPGAGIPEDPVTGSIHATLVPYWAARLGRGALRAYQASTRGGWLTCHDHGDRVHVAGAAQTFMRATITLP